MPPQSLSVSVFWDSLTEPGVALSARLAGLSACYLSLLPTSTGPRYHTCLRFKCKNSNPVTHRAFPQALGLPGIIFANTILLTLWELHVYSSALTRQWGVWHGKLIWCFLDTVLRCCAHSPALRAHLRPHPIRVCLVSDYWLGKQGGL